MTPPPPPFLSLQGLPTAHRAAIQTAAITDSALHDLTCLPVLPHLPHLLHLLPSEPNTEAHFHPRASCAVPSAGNGLSPTCLRDPPLPASSGLSTNIKNTVSFRGKSYTTTSTSLYYRLISPKQIFTTHVIICLLSIFLSSLQEHWGPC